MVNLEEIVNQPQKKGFFRRIRNWVGGALLGSSLLLGSYLPGCVGREEEFLVPDEQTQQDTTPPANVANFTATPGDMKIDLTWMNPTDSDFGGVMLRRKTASFPANPTDGTLVYQGTAQSRTDTGRTNGVTYFYRIFTSDEVPNYSSGATASAVPLDAIPPTNVTGFIANPGDTLVNLSWVNPTDSDFAGVMLRRKTASFPTSPTDGILVYSGTGQSRIDSGLTNGTTFFYKIFALDEVPNYSSGSNASAIPADTTPPGNVTGFTTTANYLSTNLAWTNPTDLDFAGVRILRKITSYPTSPTDGTVIYTGTAQTHTDSGLAEAVNYYYTAFAFDEVPNYPSGSNATAQPYGVYAVGWIGGGSNGWKTTSGATLGTDYRSLANSYGCFVDSSGNIYISDTFNDRVCKWDSSGNAIGWIGGGTNGWKTSSGAVAGSDYQSFSRPRGLSVDSSGNIYVIDTSNHRVSKWSGAGNAIGWIGGGTNGWQTSNGASNSSNYQSFAWPVGIFLDTSGNICIADSANNRVSKWSGAGNAIGWIGGGSNGWKTFAGASFGSDYRSFGGPTDVCIDSSGNVYVADSANIRVSKWSGAGNAIGWIGGGTNGWQTGSAPTSGAWDYQSFNYPGSIRIDNIGDLLIGDNNCHRVSKWNSSGTAIGWIGDGSNGWKTSNGASVGSNYQNFNGPFGISIDTTNNIYIVDYNNHRISKWQD